MPVAEAAVLLSYLFWKSNLLSKNLSFFNNSFLIDMEIENKLNVIKKIEAT